MCQYLEQIENGKWKSNSIWLTRVNLETSTTTTAAAAAATTTTTTTTTTILQENLHQPSLPVQNQKVLLE